MENKPKIGDILITKSCKAYLIIYDDFELSYKIMNDTKEKTDIEYWYWCIRLDEITISLLRGVSYDDYIAYISSKDITFNKDAMSNLLLIN